MPSQLAKKTCGSGRRFLSSLMSIPVTVDAHPHTAAVPVPAVEGMLTLTSR